MRGCALFIVCFVGWGGWWRRRRRRGATSSCTRWIKRTEWNEFVWMEKESSTAGLLNRSVHAVSEASSIPFHGREFIVGAVLTQMLETPHRLSASHAAGPWCGNHISLSSQGLTRAVTTYLGLTLRFKKRRKNHRIDSKRKNGGPSKRVFKKKTSFQ